MRPALSSLALILALVSGAPSSGAQASPSGFGSGGVGFGRPGGSVVAPRGGLSVAGPRRSAHSLAPFARGGGAPFFGASGRTRFGLDGEHRAFRPGSPNRFGRGFGYGFGYPFALGLSCGVSCESAPGPVEVVTVEVPARSGSVGIRPSPVEPPAIYVIGERRSSGRVRGSMRRPSAKTAQRAPLGAGSGVLAPRITQVTARR